MITKDYAKLEEENHILDEALYWACNYIVNLADKDVNKLPYEWAEHFIERAKENLKNWSKL